jgi:hypothetical protein
MNATIRLLGMKDHCYASIHQYKTNVKIIQINVTAIMLFTLWQRLFPSHLLENRYLIIILTNEYTNHNIPTTQHQTTQTIHTPMSCRNVFTI